jgi:tetratricopeptide (TPR) repeat protein
MHFGHFVRYAALMFGLMAVSSVNASPWSDSYKLETEQRYMEAEQVLLPESQGEDPEMVQLRLGWLRYLQGRYNEAIQTYRQAIQMNPESIDARLGVALPLLAQLRFREAEAQARTVLNIAPWNYTAHERLMAAEAGQLQWQALLNHTSILHQRYPSDTGTLAYMALAHANLGQVGLAKSAYFRVLNRIPEHQIALNYLSTH